MLHSRRQLFRIALLHPLARLGFGRTRALTVDERLDRLTKRRELLRGILALQHGREHRISALDSRLAQLKDALAELGISLKFL